jgi:hypothetical protein
MRKRKNNAAVKIDEDALRSVPSVWQRLKNAVMAVVMVIVLLQVIYLNAFVVWIYNPYFLAGLGICAALGAWKGDRFIQSINREIGRWKFW